MALVLAGTGSLLQGGAAEVQESPIEAFSRKGQSGSETILFSAQRDPGRSLAVSVSVPGIPAEDLASARVVFKLAGETVVGMPLSAAMVEGRLTFQALGSDAGEWDTALVLVERHDRALLVKEFGKTGIDLVIPDNTLPMPESPAAPVEARPLGPGERIGLAIELVIKEALLLPAPVERFLFGS